MIQLSKFRRKASGLQQLFVHADDITVWKQYPTAQDFTTCERFCGLMTHDVMSTLQSFGCAENVSTLMPIRFSWDAFQSSRWSAALGDTRLCLIVLVDHKQQFSESTDSVAVPLTKWQYGHFLVHDGSTKTAIAGICEKAKEGIAETWP